MKIMTNFTAPMKKLIQNTLLAFIPRDTIETNDNGEAKTLKCYKIGGYYIATRIKPKKNGKKNIKKMVETGIASLIT